MRRAIAVVILIIILLPSETFALSTNKIIESDEVSSASHDKFIKKITTKRNYRETDGPQANHFTGIYEAKKCTSINDCVETLGAGGGSLVITAPMTLSDNLSIPSNLKLIIEKGGSIIRTSIYKLNINGSFVADNYQIFFGFSAGDIVFADSAVKEVNPIWWGAKGDGITDDSSAIQAAIDAHKFVYIPAGTYKLKKGLTTTRTNIRGSGRDTILKLCTSSSPENNTLFVKSIIDTAYTVRDSSLSEGQMTITLSSVTGLNVGDTILLLYGNDPYDSNEERLRLLMQIISIDSGAKQVTFKTGIPEAVTAPGTHKILYSFKSIAESLTFSELAFDYFTGTIPDVYIPILWARNITLQNLYAVRSPGIFIEYRESEFLHAQNIYVDSQTMGHISAKAFNSWGCRNCGFLDIFVKNAVDVGVFSAESQNRGLYFRNLFVESCNLDGSKTIMNVTGGSRGVSLDGLHYSGVYNESVVSVSQASEIITRNVTLSKGVKSFPLKYHDGHLIYNGTMYSETQTFLAKFKIDSGLNGKAFYLFSGFPKTVRIYTNSVAGINAFYFVNLNGQGGNIVSQLAADKWVDITGSFYSVGSDYPFNSMAEKRIDLYTGTVDEGTYIIVYVEYLAVNRQ